jgi:6,7-dimethyl-8-ribityllumazine synthase
MPAASPHAIEGEVRPVPGARYAIIASRWNPRITDALVEGARAALSSNGVPEAQLDIVRVPGALELPVTAQVLARAGRHAALIALGCVVRGETRHYEHVADETARGLMRVSLDHALPVANGVLAVERHADAEARAGGVHGNKGEEAALAALEMAWLLLKLGPSLSMPVRLPAREASR